MLGVKKSALFSVILGFMSPFNIHMFDEGFVYIWGRQLLSALNYNLSTYFLVHTDYSA